MRDFTTEMLYLLLSALKSAGYSFMTVAGYLHKPCVPAVILRHDVDAMPANSRICAEMENRLGITGTYYFRTVAGAWDEEVIREIHNLGHETGYHYEDLAAAKGDYEKAIISFGENLAKLRLLVPVETICMHGSPLSKYDNRLMWERYSYRDLGITGEPYLDIDFQSVHYLTDTGRRWNGEKFSLRDRVSSARAANGKVNRTGLAQGEEEHYSFRSTPEIIRAAESGNLPPVIMITIHPQRWESRYLPWIRELIWQNIKNVVKRFLTTS